jgi:hypothetical protein
MHNRSPKLGDLIMLMKPEIITLPPQPKRGRPSKKNPLNIRTETHWHDDVEALVVKGPHQNISSDGEDYWLEWTVKRLDNDEHSVITTTSRFSYIKFRFID